MSSPSQSSPKKAVEATQKKAADSAIPPLYRALHLIALSSMAFAQPLYEVLKPNAEFFVARSSQPIDLIAMVIGLTLLPPLALFLVEGIAGLAHRRLAQWLHLAFVAGLVTVIILPPLKRSWSYIGTNESLMAMAGGLVAAVLYARAEKVRSFLSVLSLAPVVFAYSFLSSPAISKVINPVKVEVQQLDGAPTTSVAMLVLDELPLTSLVDENRQINEALFPNFAQLAKESDWYRNATSNHSATTYVIPSIVAGNLPSRRNLLPIAADYPKNIFTMLGGSHRMFVKESVTNLCPEGLLEIDLERLPFAERMNSMADDMAMIFGHMALPNRLAKELPSVTGNWGDFRGGGAVEEAPSSDDAPGAGQRDRKTTAKLRAERRKAEGAARSRDREALVRSYIDVIDDSLDPTLYFLHVLLPHEPWVYTPDGYRYASGNIPGETGGVWSGEEVPVRTAFQRHLLQVAHCDRLVGDWMNRLKEQGIWDRSLVVVVADHGVSFRTGHHRRSMDEVNVQDLMPIPLFIKEPGQKEGKVRDVSVETVDILPTVFDVLGTELPFKPEGSSVARSEESPREKKVMFDLRGNQFEFDSKLPDEWPALTQRHEIFGRELTEKTLYAMGPHPDLVGIPVSQAGVVGEADIEVSIDDAQAYEEYDSTSAVSHCYLVGNLRASTQADLPPAVAVAINGVIQACTSLFEIDGGRASFTAMVPPKSFRDGKNDVSLYAVDDRGRLLSIDVLSHELEQDSNGRATQVVRSDGQIFDVVDEGLKGSLLVVAPGPQANLRLKGFVYDDESDSAVDTIVVFAHGRQVYCGPALSPSEQLLKVYPKRTGIHGCGFQIYIDPKSISGGVDGSIKVFGLKGSRACELRYNERTHWAIDLGS